MDELRAISADIAEYIARYYAAQPASAGMRDVLTPHAMAHQIAANYPGLGAAFYRLVEAAANVAANQ